MKKFFIVIIIFTFFLKFNAKSEIAYIDLNYILKSSEVGKFLNNYIKNIQLEYEQKYKSIEDDTPSIVILSVSVLKNFTGVPSFEMTLICGCIQLGDRFNN